MTIILCCTKEQSTQFKEELSKYNHKVIESKCDKLEESMPVVMTIPDGTFYGRVTPDRILEVIVDTAGDLKIQTARLYDVEMEKYFSEAVYRASVFSFYKQINQLVKWDKENIIKNFEQFCKTQTLSNTQIIDSLKMALIKTTRGPGLTELLEAFGKKEVCSRIENYLEKYKYRF